MERQITPESLETDIAGGAVQNTRKSDIGHFRGICLTYYVTICIIIVSILF